LTLNKLVAAGPNRRLGHVNRIAATIFKRRDLRGSICCDYGEGFPTIPQCRQTIHVQVTKY
jgi:hypothetical protein